LTKILNLLMSK